MFFLTFCVDHKRIVQEEYKTMKLIENILIFFPNLLKANREEILETCIKFDSDYEILLSYLKKSFRILKP
jgi:hypothetical protein